MQVFDYHARFELAEGEVQLPMPVIGDSIYLIGGSIKPRIKLSPEQFEPVSVGVLTVDPTKIVIARANELPFNVTEVARTRNLYGWRRRTTMLAEPVGQLTVSRLDESRWEHDADIQPDNVEALEVLKGLLAETLSKAESRQWHPKTPN